jgi:hypothetical protein
MKNAFGFSVVVVILVLAQVPVWGQKYYSTWPISWNTSMVFGDNGANATLSRSLRMVPRNGSAVYCDPCTGQVLLYSLGADVRRPDGSVIAGTESDTIYNRGSRLIQMAPWPGNDRHVLVVRRGIRTLYPDTTGRPLEYLVIDLDGNGGRGSVIVPATILGPTPEITNCVDITTSTGGGLWIVALVKVDGGAEFRSYKVTTAGIVTDPVRSALPAELTRYIQDQKMWFTPQGDRLAILAWSARIMIADFDRAAGSVDVRSYYRYLPDFYVWTRTTDEELSSLWSGTHLAWSPSGRYLYMFFLDEEHRYTRFNCYNVRVEVEGDGTVVGSLVIDKRRLDRDWRYPSPTTGRNISLGPDGRIYYSTERMVDVIENPDADDADLIFRREVLFPDELSPIVFPAIVQPLLFGPVPTSCLPPSVSASVGGACPGDTVRLTITDLRGTGSVTVRGDGIEPDFVQGSGPFIVRLVGSSPRIVVTATNRNGIAEDTLYPEVYTVPERTVPDTITVCPFEQFSVAVADSVTAEWSADWLTPVRGGRLDAQAPGSDNALVVRTWSTRGCSRTDTIAIRMRRDGVADSVRARIDDHRFEIGKTSELTINIASTRPIATELSLAIPTRKFHVDTTHAIAGLTFSRGFDTTHIDWSGTVDGTEELHIHGVPLLHEDSTWQPEITIRTRDFCIDAAVQSGTITQRACSDNVMRGIIALPLADVELDGEGILIRPNSAHGLASLGISGTLHVTTLPGETVDYQEFAHQQYVRSMVTSTISRQILHIRMTINGVTIQKFLVN